MDLSFKTGHRQETVSIPEENLLGVLSANEIPTGLTGIAEVRRALNHPIGQKPISQLFHPGETVAIVTSDITRPMPTAQVMPVLLEELYQAFRKLGADATVLAMPYGGSTLPYLTQT